MMLIDTYELLGKLVRAVDAKKAMDLRVLDVRGKSSITDFLVIATGNSETHLRALRVETEKILDAAKAPIAGMDMGVYGCGWLVMDAFQIMLHFFSEERRGEYKLEKLWQDAKEIAVEEFLEVVKPVKKVAKKRQAAVGKKPVVKKVAVKKTTKAKATKKVSVKKAKKASVKKSAPAKTKIAAKKKAVVKKVAAKKVSKK